VFFLLPSSCSSPPFQPFYLLLPLCFSTQLEKLEEIYEDNLICGICHELLYKCVTVIPCLHNFCAACLSSWFERSKVCPSCRDESQGIRKNHAINNLVESYLEANPEKKRDPEELKEMDQKNQITEEMVSRLCFLSFSSLHLMTFSFFHPSFQTASTTSPQEETKGL
jgi:hypothetical protein